MFKNIFVASLFFVFASAALAATSKYELTLVNETMAPLHIASIVIQPSEDVAAETKLYDARDIEVLSAALRRKVERDLNAKGLMSDDGVQLVITITKLKPNRPTMAQYKDKYGLDARSIALGGASLEAKFITIDGAEAGSISFVWEERWIDQLQGATTWYDARRAFDRFSRRLARDLAALPHS